MNKADNTQLVRAYNQYDEISVYAGKVIMNLGDGRCIVATGSARIIAEKIEPVKVGDKFYHFLFGPVEITKINKKSIKLKDLIVDKPVPDIKL